MGFLDDFSEKAKDFTENFAEKATDVAQKATEKAKDVASITKIKADIATEERKIKEQYTEIGKIYYENYSSVPDDAFVDAIQKIKKSTEIIDAKKKELEQSEVKKTAEVVEDEDLFCPSCGVKLYPNSNYCSKCGAKIGK